MGLERNSLPFQKNDFFHISHHELLFSLNFKFLILFLFSQKRDDWKIVGKYRHGVRRLIREILNPSEMRCHITPSLT